MPLHDDIALISVDDHVVEPPTVWTDRLPAKYQEAAPHVVDGPNNTQDWVWEGRHYPVSLQGNPNTRRFRGDEAGKGDDFHSRSYADMIEACYDVHARVKAMDEDGVTAGLNFPTFPRFAGTGFLEAQDKELASLIVEAYNDWMIDEWAGSYPDRFIPMIITQLWDPALGAKEIERAAAKGAKAITFTENPATLGLPSFWTKHWDPVFAAASETGLSLCLHIGTSGKLVLPAPEATMAVPISLCGLNAMSACADLIYSGILHRHPTVKIALSEGGAGWVPYLVERMDYTWERTRIDVDKSIPPSELFKRHFWACFISDQTAIDNRHDIGIDKLMWEGDFPHNDSQFPLSRKLLEKSMTDVPDDEVRQITELNARELFNFWS
jgi:predicted TIM-barrel fold metal-dependent hydrolase